MAPTLGYWKIRGLGQPIRYMLAYAGVEFEDKYHDLDWEKWVTEDKYSLGLVFPNLPYYIDEEENVKLTHVVAILRHLARKHGLMADGEEATILQDMAEQQMVDFFSNVFDLVYGGWDDPVKKERFCKSMFPSTVEGAASCLGDKTWISGEKLTYVDFLVYEFMDWALYMEPKCMDNFPHLRKYLERFENIPAISEYRNSSRFMAWPIAFKTARFGYKLEDKLLRFPEQK